MTRRVGDLGLAISLALIGLSVAALIVIRAVWPSDVAQPVTR